MIWVNVALPPTTEQPPHAKGKTPTSDVSESHLRRRKMEALRLCLSFAFAAKHYLRGEDGTHWDDYADVLPASLKRGEESAFGTQKTFTTYSATRDSSKAGSRGSNESGRSSPDATKRVRPKRSKQNLSSQNTPLLANPDRMVTYPFADQMSLPFPLLFVS